MYIILSLLFIARVMSLYEIMRACVFVSSSSPLSRME